MATKQLEYEERERSSPNIDARPAARQAIRLHSPWHLLVLGGWLVLVAIAIVLFGLAVPALYTQHLTPDAAVQAGLAQLGLSPAIYAAYWVVLHVIFAAVYFGVAAILVWRKPNEPFALFVSLFLTFLGGVNGATTGSLIEAHPGLSFLIDFSFSLTVVSLIMFLFLFPDGRFVPSWLRLPAGIWSVLIFLVWLAPGLATGGSSPHGWVFLLFAGGFTVAGGAQIYRYLHISTSGERIQTKWIVFATTTAIVGQVAGVLAGEIFPELKQPGLPALFYELASVLVLVLSFLLIPLAIGVAILRYRLWDIDLILNRTLVYGALTLVVIGLYVLVVGGLGALLHQEGSLFISLLGTALIAILFQPLRERLQRAASRLIYGEHDDPYAVISRLSQRLGATFAFEKMLPTIVETVRDTLRLPYVGIALQQDGTFPITVESGNRVEPLVSLPLTYHGETIGRLLLAQRSREETFTRSERRLLADLTYQAGVALYAARLTADLQRSRERLVTAREEERRRLRRDLHDGLGPQLAALTLKVETVRSRLSHEPLADALLGDLTARMQEAVADIRRLVHGLHPPILDELGLIQALCQVTTQYNHQGVSGLQVGFEAPESLPPLSAAVEVAVYHITQEALTNVIRHAAAKSCTVRLTWDVGFLCLEVCDDGRGLGQSRGTGVGLRSMRERVEELGGRLTIETSPTGGTRIKVQLPCQPSALAQRKSERI